MEKMLRGGLTAEEYVQAIKSGKYFLQKRTGTKENPVCFLQDPETERVIGKEYSSFEFTECEYNPETNVLKVGAELELTERADISVSAEFIDLEKGEVYAVFSQKECLGSRSLSYHEEVVLSGESPVVNVDLAVVAIANWQVGSETVNTVSLIKELRGYQFAYEHKYPKKETLGYIEFKDDSQGTVLTGEEAFLGDMDTGVRGSADTINIALFREPDDLKDLDYLCSFHKDDKGRPRFTVPASGCLSITNLVGNKKIISAEAYCYIADRKGIGGYYLVASSATSGQKIVVDIEEDGASVSYEYIQPWDDAFIYGGSWQKYYFKYTLQITLKIGTDESGTLEVLRLYVSSSDQWEGLLKKIPDVMIMWGCMAENTFIKMANGSEKKIQEIIAGDEVSLGIGKATVKTKWSGPSEGCVIVRAAGRTLKMTKDHPVMTAEGWKRAEQLKITDEIMGAAKIFVRIDGIETDTGEIQTFNLEYEDNVTALIDNEEYMIAEGFIVGNMKTQNNHSF